MLISKGLTLFKCVSKHAKRKNILVNKQINKFSHEWAYREYGEPSKLWNGAAEIAGGLAWWWFLYRMYYDYSHITGHWEYPDPSKWTDEELGIPPDDAD